MEYFVFHIGKINQKLQRKINFRSNVHSIIKAFLFETEENERAEVTKLCIDIERMEYRQCKKHFRADTAKILVRKMKSSGIEASFNVFNRIVISLCLVGMRHSCKGSHFVNIFHSSGLIKFYINLMKDESFLLIDRVKVACILCFIFMYKKINEKHIRIICMIFLTFLSTLGNLTPKEVPIVPKCSIIFALKCLCSDSSNHRFLHFYGLDAILIDLEKDENKEVRSFASDAIKMLKNVNMQLWDHVYCAKMSGTRRFNDFPGDDLMRSATLLEKTKSSFLMDQTCSCQQISSILMTKIFNEYIYRPHITQPNKVVASSRTLELRPFSELCTLSTSILSSPKSDCPEAFKLPGCESKRLPFEESSYLAYSKKENFQKDLNKRKCEIIASVFKYQKLFSRRGFNIYLHRKSVFGDAVNTVMKMSKNDLDSKWMIVFLREYGFDNGGLFREFVTIVVSELCDVNVGIMNCITDSTTSRAGCGSLILRRREKVTLEDLTFCRFFGRIIAKAFEMSVVLPVNINELFFKQLLRSGYCSSSFASSLTPSSSSSPSAKSSHLIKEMLNDLSLISADICSSLQYVLECETPAKLAELDLHFVTTLDDEYGAREFPLVPGGKFIQVVMENREEFVALSCLAHLVWGTEQQMEAIRVGFNDVIPLKLVASAIRGEELAMIMCGDGEVNASDLRAHTEFVNGAGYKEIDWFFEIVEEMSKEEKARLMVFVTGSPRVPFGGASRLIGTIEILRCFRIYMIISRKDILPRSHTCNNQIDLPLYSSKEIMRKCLLIACFEGCVGFEMW